MGDDGPMAPLIEATHRRLRERGDRLAIAESCTGGLAGAAMTAVGGASDVFEYGYVTYSNRAKIELLAVPSRTIEATGAVSGPTARAMAVGVRDRLSAADWGVAITGLAGPSGDRPGKPVGTVYVAIAGGASDPWSVARRRRFDGDRDAIRHQSVRAAFELLLAGLGQPAASKRPA